MDHKAGLVLKIGKITGRLKYCRKALFFIFKGEDGIFPEVHWKMNAGMRGKCNTRFFGLQVFGELFAGLFSISWYNVRLKQCNKKPPLLPGGFFIAVYFLLLSESFLAIFFVGCFLHRIVCIVGGAQPALFHFESLELGGFISNFWPAVIGCIDIRCFF